MTSAGLQTNGRFLHEGRTIGEHQARYHRNDSMVWARSGFWNYGPVANAIGIMTPVGAIVTWTGKTRGFFPSARATTAMLV